VSCRDKYGDDGLRENQDYKSSSREERKAGLEDSRLAHESKSSIGAMQVTTTRSTEEADSRNGKDERRSQEAKQPKTRGVIKDMTDERHDKIQGTKMTKAIPESEKAKATKAISELVDKTRKLKMKIENRDFTYLYN
jgi:hypothetical protein